MSLPPGYGYPNRGTDRWGLLYMLMNHTPRTLTGYVRYTVQYVVGEQLTPVKPVWLDVRNCTGPDPSFDVPGTGGRFSVYTRTMSCTTPESGFIVGAGGHLHGGGIRLELRNVTCAKISSSSRSRPGAALCHGRSSTSPGRRTCPKFTSAPGDPSRGGTDAPHPRRLRQRGTAHAGDGDHDPLHGVGTGERLSANTEARRRPRPPRLPAVVHVPN